MTTTSSSTKAPATSSPIWGLPHDREDMLKVEIAHAISAAIRKRGLTQTAAGEIIGVDQGQSFGAPARASAGFSVERLIVFLIKLGRDVDIMISRSHKNREGMRSG